MVGLFGVAAEHHPVERSRHDQPVEVLGGRLRIVDLQGPASCQVLEGGSQRGDGARGTALVEQEPQIREATCLGDYQAAQLHDSWLGHLGKQRLREVAQVCLQVAAVAEAGHLLGNGVGDLGHGVSHDLAEQALLVGELLVDGLL